MAQSFTTYAVAINNSHKVVYSSNNLQEVVDYYLHVNQNRTGYYSPYKLACIVERRRYVLPILIGPSGVIRKPWSSNFSESIRSKIEKDIDGLVLCQI